MLMVVMKTFQTVAPGAVSSPYKIFRVEADVSKSFLSFNERPSDSDFFVMTLLPQCVLEELIQLVLIQSHYLVPCPRLTVYALLSLLLTEKQTSKKGDGNRPMRQ